MFYNTGISHLCVGAEQPQARPAPGQGAAHRRHQLVPTAAQEPGQEELRGKAEDDITRICDTFLDFKETEQSKIFDNAAFGYWKVTVDRPLRIRGAAPRPRLQICRTQKAQGERPSQRGRAARHQEDSQAGRRGRPGARRRCSRPASTGRPKGGGRVRARPMSCATPSRFHDARDTGGIEMPSCDARSCPTPPMPGISPTAQRLATRSASPATSTRRSPCAAWMRSGPKSWPWRRRPRDCSTRSSEHSRLTILTAGLSEDSELWWCITLKFSFRGGVS